MLSSIIRSKKKSSFMDSSYTDPEGLRILINLTNDQNSSKVVIKPNLCLNQTDHHHHHHQSYCFLKSCHLCGKILSLDEEVYMYKGEMGFCSLECRDRQMYMDEMNEIEISTKKVLESLRRRRCESSRISEEFRRRRHPFPSENDRVIFL